MLTKDVGKTYTEDEFCDESLKDADTSHAAHVRVCVCGGKEAILTFFFEN